MTATDNLSRQYWPEQSNDLIHYKGIHRRSPMPSRVPWRRDRIRNALLKTQRVFVHSFIWLINYSSYLQILFLCLLDFCGQGWPLLISSVHCLDDLGHFNPFHPNLEVLKLMKKCCCPGRKKHYMLLPACFEPIPWSKQLVRAKGEHGMCQKQSLPVRTTITIKE